MFNNGDAVQHKDGTLGHVMMDLSVHGDDSPYVLWVDEQGNEWASNINDVEVV